MSRTFPALDLAWLTVPGDERIDLALAALDDCGPTAVEAMAQGVRVFFASEHDRDAAATVAEALDGVTTTRQLVPDEAWAERSQASITAVKVGRIIVTPPWLPAVAAGDDIVIVIQPSMGFGTGHHASTRLCLDLLQRREISGHHMIDVGTGSGVLAIAAHRLGASSALGIDYDADALLSARENVELNAVDALVRLGPVDITREDAIGGHDVMTANLTGAMLMRHAARLVAELRSGGTLIVSGFQTDERAAVIDALEAVGTRFVRDLTEDTWVAAELTRV